MVVKIVDILHRLKQSNCLNISFLSIVSENDIEKMSCALSKRLYMMAQLLLSSHNVKEGVSLLSSLSVFVVSFSLSSVDVVQSMNAPCFCPSFFLGLCILFLRERESCCRRSGCLFAEISPRWYLYGWR